MDDIWLKFMSMWFELGDEKKVIVWLKIRKFIWNFWGDLLRRMLVWLMIVFVIKFVINFCWKCGNKLYMCICEIVNIFFCIDIIDCNCVVN